MPSAICSDAHDDRGLHLERVEEGHLVGRQVPHRVDAEGVDRAIPLRRAPRRRRPSLTAPSGAEEAQRHGEGLVVQAAPRTLAKRPLSSSTYLPPVQAIAHACRRASAPAAACSLRDEVEREHQRAAAPWPTSPNMMPKRKGKSTTAKAPGFTSRYRGTPYVSTSAWKPAEMRVVGRCVGGTWLTGWGRGWGDGEGQGEA